jgi:hypothetical protein
MYPRTLWSPCMRRERQMGDVYTRPTVVAILAATQRWPAASDQLFRPGDQVATDLGERRGGIRGPFHAVSAPRGKQSAEVITAVGR